MVIDYMNRRNTAIPAPTLPVGEGGNLTLEGKRCKDLLSSRLWDPLPPLSSRKLEARSP